MPEPCYFHGGKPHLKIGSLILPPTITKEPSLSEYGAAGVHRRDRVYVTTEKAAAAIYAAMHHSGIGRIYEVEPIGGLDHDPDCLSPGLSFQCEKAKIVSMQKLSGKEIKRIRKIMMGLV
jgi:hypothetical protein